MGDVRETGAMGEPDRDELPVGEDRGAAEALHPLAAPGAAPGAPVTQAHDAAEIAKELVVDLRSELPRVDARAAAGVALSAAILVSVAGQSPVPMPIYAIAVVAAALLTVALFLFLMVLLPAPDLLSHRVLLREQPDRTHQLRLSPPEPADRRFGRIHRAVDGHGRRGAEVEALEERGRQLVAHLAGVDRAEYHAGVAVQIAAQIRTKRRLLFLAFVSGSLAVAVLALGASWALLLGWR